MAINLGDVSKFKYLTHKVMPLVFDETLSYYEFLCKVIAKLNEVIDNENTQNATLEDFSVQMDEWNEEAIQKYNEFTAAIDLEIEQFEQSMEDRQGAFETEIGERADGFEDRITDQQDTFEGEMRDAWNEFFETYLQTLGVVQVTGQSTTDVMSQKAVSDELDTINTNIDTFVITTRSDTPVNLLHGSVSVDHYIDIDGEDISSPDDSHSDYFEVEPGRKICCTRQATSATRVIESYRSSVAFYDSTYTFIERIGSQSEPIKTVPENAKYAIQNCPSVYWSASYKLMVEYTDDEGTIADEYSEWFAPYNQYFAQHTTDLIDQNICCFGDSLAANGSGGTDTWIQYVADYFKCNKAYNRGISGSTITAKDKDGVNRVAYAYVDAEGDAYNRIIYNTQQSIPDYTEITPFMESTERVNTIPTDTDVVIIIAGANDVSTTTSTMFRTAYETMLNKIMNRVPNAKIYPCTLVYNHTYDSNPATKEVYDNYRKIIQEIASDYGFPCFNLRAEMGINNQNYTSYMNVDGIHYNTPAGKIIFGECVCDNVKRYSKIYITE